MQENVGAEKNIKVEEIKNNKKKIVRFGSGLMHTKNARLTASKNGEFAVLYADLNLYKGEKQLDKLNDLVNMFKHKRTPSYARSFKQFKLKNQINKCLKGKNDTENIQSYKEFRQDNKRLLDLLQKRNNEEYFELESALYKVVYDSKDKAREDKENGSDFIKNIKLLKKFVNESKYKKVLEELKNYVQSWVNIGLEKISESNRVGVELLDKEIGLLDPERKNVLTKLKEAITEAVNKRIRENKELRKKKDESNKPADMNLTNTAAATSRDESEPASGVQNENKKNQELAIKALTAAIEDAEASGKDVTEAQNMLTKIRRIWYAGMQGSVDRMVSSLKAGQSSQSSFEEMVKSKGLLQ